ncbi:FKBP-type peptidyl-prolyl cis-trans isomerase [Rhodanobacter geophilus]|uniref:Peptidyl-prolyl cis-trans isomerase n=1 Tax=Rhodanobacter geophilus TaxID=3162488 RepID=A0ABV3QNH0_9GAMM
MTRLRWLLPCLLLVGVAHAQIRPQQPAPAKLDKAKLSYAIGYQIGSQFVDGRSQAGIPDVDIATLQRAIQDAYNKRPPAVSMQAMHQQLSAFNQQLRTDAQAEFEQVAAANARKSAAFMANNAKQPGVVQLPSGIQYSVLKKGDGTASPTVSSTVVVNYRGMLVDGTEFDSTWAHGAPVSFTVDHVIPGWRDVIPRMHVGDRWKVVIPPQLAYGKEGALPRIGPNEALVFEIELLAIKPPAPDQDAP